MGMSYVLFHTLSLSVSPPLLVWERRGEYLDTLNHVVGPSLGWVLDESGQLVRGTGVVFRSHTGPLGGFGLFRLASAAAAATRWNSCASPAELASAPRFDQSTM